MSRNGRTDASGTDRAAVPPTFPDGQSPSLRRILIDIIEEYARVDGLTGKDPPR